jgi:YVTN family beta-propeller protein
VKAASIVVCICCCLSPVSAQWLEKTIAVDSGPRVLCYNSLEDKVYCANSYGNTVSVIDCSTNSVARTVAVGQMPYDLAMTSSASARLQTADEKLEYVAARAGIEVAIRGA